MRALYFDCASGISGNMTIGALLELVDDYDWFKEKIESFPIDGYHLHLSRETKNGISGTYFDVHLDDHHHDHDHHKHAHHHHEHRHLSDVNKIIDEADISEHAKDLAKAIFLRVAKAEAKVHNEDIEEVHFHEVGAVDSIIDIIGTAILIDRIHPDVIYSSIVNHGYGFIECAHGTIPVPAPATSEIFAASNVVSRQIDINTEIVTPTGAAIIAELASRFGPMPAMNVKKIGWGCGYKNLKIPNILKVSLGEINDQSDEILVMETNVDDCTGEMLGYVMERMMDAGAKDVFFTPIFMKKNRPAYRITMVTDDKHRKVIEDILFKNTTTIGLRYRREKRHILSREAVDIHLPEGTVKGKQVYYGDERYVYPEYESLRNLAEEVNVPLKQLYKRFEREV